LKGKIVLPLILLTLLPLSTCLAEKPVDKIVVIEHIDMDGTQRFVGLRKFTVIIFNEDGTMWDVSLTILISVRIYQGGEFIGTMKISAHYQGTTDVSGEGMVGTPENGKLTYDLESTGLIEDEVGDLHLVIWYENGDPSQIGEGEPWWPD
jgi:hypothetical protein